MQRRAAIGAVAAVGLAAVAVLLWPEGPRESASLPGADAGQETRLATLRPAAAEAPAEREPAGTFDGATSDAFLTVVSSADGAPVPGAEVHLRRAETRRSHMRWSDAQQRTDSRGRVSFPALPVVEYDLSVYCDFFEAHYGLFASGATVALEPILPVHGRVLSASRVPVAGALVSSMGHAPRITSTSGADGRFELQIPSLDFVVAEKNGVVGFSASLQYEDIDRSAEFEIVLDDGDELTLRVLLDPDPPHTRRRRYLGHRAQAHRRSPRGRFSARFVQARPSTASGCGRIRLLTSDARAASDGARRGNGGEGYPETAGRTPRAGVVRAACTQSAEDRTARARRFSR